MAYSGIMSYIYLDGIADSWYVVLGMGFLLPYYLIYIFVPTCGYWFLSCYDDFHVCMCFDIMQIDMMSHHTYVLI